jgi:GntR family transcriptional regulator
MGKLRQTDAVPLYKQLKNIIKKDIANGVLKPNERLPSEAELSKTYEISRITVRNAITELVEENLLVKKQGKGTFVCEKKIVRNIVPVMGFSEICRISNLEPGSRVISASEVAASERDIEVFQLEPHDTVVSILRVRTADSVPVILEKAVYPKHYAFLLAEDLGASLYDLLRKKYRVDFAHARKSIELTFATEKQAGFLNISKGYPMILIQGVVMDTAGKPIHRTDQYIVGDKFKLLIDS